MIGRKTRRGGIAPLFIVDVEFAEEVERWSWMSHGKGYLYARVSGRNTLLHRFVWQLKHGDCPPILDHINGVKWDCRLENLRPATHSLNMLNLTRRRTKHDLPRGVHHADGNANHFFAAIRVNGKQRHLGTFSTPEAASAAYEKARSEEMTRRAEVARNNT